MPHEHTDHRALPPRLQLDARPQMSAADVNVTFAADAVHVEFDATSLSEADIRQLTSDVLSDVQKNHLADRHPEGILVIDKRNIRVNVNKHGTARCAAPLRLVRVQLKKTDGPLRVTTKVHDPAYAQMAETLKAAAEAHMQS